MISESRAAINHLAAWLGLVVAVLVMAHIVEAGPASFGGALPKPIEVNAPLAFTSAGLFCVSAVILLSFSLKESRIPTAILLAAGLTAFISFGLAAVSASPGLGSVVAKDRMAGVLQPATPPRFGIAILFDNNSDELSPFSRRQLENMLTVFADCQSMHATVRGFASSARFRSDSDVQNRNLANRRATEVASFLAHGGTDVEVTQWMSFEEMLAEARIVDREGGERLVLKEPANRRVEILWDQSPCSVLGTRSVRSEQDTYGAH